MTTAGRAAGVLAQAVRDGKLSRPTEAGAVWLMAGPHAGTWFVEPVRQGWRSMRDELLQVARYRKHDGDAVTVWRGPGWVRLAVRQAGEVVILAEVWRPVEVR